MPGLSILLLLLVAPQDARDSDSPAEKARRAAIVDRIMGVPGKNAMKLAPVAPPVAPALAPAPAPGKAVARLVQIQQQRRRVTLEVKAVEEPPDVQDDDNAQPGFRFGINITDFALAKDNFNRWLFDDERPDEARRARLDEMLAGKMDALQKSEMIDPDQLGKLKLAGLGDIKRFLDRVEAARAEFEALRQDFSAGQAALGRLDSLAGQYQSGPFGSGSLFEKALRKMKADKESATAPAK